MITAKQLSKWIAKWESGPAREKHLFGFLEPAASEDLAEYLEKRINRKGNDDHIQDHHRGVQRTRDHA